MDKHADFIIPEEFIKQLEEFSNGGFVLLTFTRNGNPVAYQSYDTKKDQMAMEAFVEKFCERLTRSRFADEENSISASSKDSDDEEDGEEGKERA